MDSPAAKSVRFLLFLTVIILFSTGCNSKTPSGEPVNVGLIAPLTGPLASSGEAIKRGILLGIEEINAQGGVLGRPLALVVRDVQNNPEMGVDTLHELVEKEDIAAVFGGIFSPVMVAQLNSLQELQIPLINPWGSMTAITENGQSPNYAFRISVSDNHADEFLVRYTLNILNAKNPGIIADNSMWGEANVTGLKEWLRILGVEPAGIVRFDQGETDMTYDLQTLINKGADSLLMVANAPEGASIIRGRALLGWDVPVISHWGISGGHFAELAGHENVHDIYTLQTYSFFGALATHEKTFLNLYKNRFGIHDPGEILSPVGVVHGHDGLHLLAMAIEQAGSTAGSKIRNELENLGEYKGLIKDYNRPFSPIQHNALLADDYIMTVWKNGHLVPAAVSRLNRKR